MKEISIQPGKLSLQDMRSAYQAPVSVSLDSAAQAQIARGRAVIEDIIAADRVVYGVNTGFGRLAQTSIPKDQLATLQRNLVLSHAAGTGPHLDCATLRLILLLKINSLARGFSGVRPLVVDTLVQMLNREVYAAIPAKGSVGASGDLAPLAHMILTLIGEGQAYYRGELLDSATVMARAGIPLVELQAKEGLALLNGTNVSTALALKGLFDTETNFKAALVAGAMCVDAALGSVAPFDARVHEIRGHRGQILVAEHYRRLLADSEINRSHLQCGRVQDPYSLRCQPQVMGACLDQMLHAARILHTEANAVSDNPLIFADNGDVISAGNFHAEPVAMAADNLAIAIAEIGSLSERRMALLVDDNMSQLPPFLVKDAGLNSGFMIAQVTSAALTSENKGLAHPASVDSLPTSANQEDHVSMATYAARRLTDMNANLEGIISIELLAAAQGISLRRPLRSSVLLEQAQQHIRNVAGRWEQDRYFAPDIEAVRSLIAKRTFDPLIAGWALDN